VAAADSARFDRAIAAIDRANAEDPNQLAVDGSPRPRALVESELATAWALRLDPAAGEEVRLAVRAHHIRRWTSPREVYPAGRAGYLRWRRDLAEFHASEVAAILGAEGYDQASAARVQDLVRKRDLRAGADPDVQLLEDASCLVFLEADFAALADRLDHDHMVDVLRKTLVKMSAAAREIAATIPLARRDRQLLAEAVSRP
jgi:hypothetical protein